MLELIKFNNRILYSSGYHENVDMLIVHRDTGLKSAIPDLSECLGTFVDVIGGYIISLNHLA